MRNIIILAMALVVSVGFSGCTGNTGGATTKDVSATDNQFDPNTLELKEGSMIAVKNNGENLHSVTVHKVNDPATTTKKDTNIEKGASTDYKFEESGTYHVYCKYHTPPGQFQTGMVLTVTVTEA